MDLALTQRLCRLCLAQEVTTIVRWIEVNTTKIARSNGLFNEQANCTPTKQYPRSGEIAPKGQRVKVRDTLFESLASVTKKLNYLPSCETKTGVKIVKAKIPDKQRQSYSLFSNQLFHLSYDQLFLTKNE
ncbi:hypothetical protein [Methylomonas albis]|uniref:Uncharacterized protein n=1 Tax=Methylomonas albis TaxID=1854563 RepID=A0ABR9CZW5_9GAMM|nr:hypothetical protein [Methylomonas albis]MBD9356091.1 hypothetical protein [Methylomonas albis]